MTTIKARLEEASARFGEMEVRKQSFLEKYRSTGEKLYLEMANTEQEMMNELMDAILKAKTDLQQKEN